jgi:Flp pilus assembly protein TadG
MGGMVDYSKMTAARTALQDAADAATLAAVRSDAKTEADMKVIAKTYLAASPAAASLVGEIKFKLTPGESKLAELWADGTSKNYFLGLVNLNQFTFDIYSRVEAGNTGLELALVLDNTYSMTAVDGTGTSRMAALKSASNTLVDTVMTGSSQSNVKVGLVPFVDYVNVGMENRKASWISVPDDYTVTGTKTCSIQHTTISYNCVKMNGTKIVDGISVPYTYNKCDTKPGPDKEVCTTPTSTYKWSGCVGSRAAPYTLVPDANGVPYPGLLNVSCGQKLMPLTTDKAQLKSAIAAMTPVNETYIPSGLIWGFNLLTPGEPFTQAGAFDAKNKNPHKAMVVMTDGVNTKSLKQPYHNGTKRSDADSMTQQSCDAIKAKNIEVYVVALDVDDAAAKTLLQYCASGADHFYDAKGSSGLTAAFQAIAQSLQQLRVSG